jgi:hypothetical protein
LEKGTPKNIVNGKKNISIEKKERQEDGEEEENKYQAWV